jgi:hypothetical protein
MMADLEYSGMTKPLERARRDAEPQPFFSVAEREALNSALRHCHVERAKEVLEIYRRVQLHGFVGDGDLSFDATAERLADLLFGERTNGGH